MFQCFDKEIISTGEYLNNKRKLISKSINVENLIEDHPCNSQHEGIRSREFKKESISSWRK